ncbi:MAG: hypothetical protein KDF67_19255 [Ottowia sp.]|uniref:hypothetical protein n=1 Tax=Ottowia sp. TaxID=1898956 RepID=UPI001E047409|nr:hypothetical protein [Ottowia sp.]MCP5256843.1 hypothetical protein [Burkholderiaceae bacterium]MCB2025818.1 hypothetical protein [Ottowia sp.]MCB2034769.1 hypothetical protein [Ottowia sp.]MCB2037377.1 hypothetical protein [Ottowia sp.]MCB2071601.1 hypothetical protein [Ottowia sp.]
MASIQRIAPSLVGMLLAGAAQAEVPAIFQGADLKLGDKLIAEHKCNQCHAQKWGRDGLDIYRPKGRIHDAGKLRGMVDYCSNQLGLTLFPEEVTAIAAALNRDHYHFQR